MIRPKKVDIDKPTGYVKRLLRRWWRRRVKQQAEFEIEQEFECCELWWP